MSGQFLYVVFDAVAESIVGPLMVLPSDAVARRTFQDAVTSERSSLSQHPQDFSLHRIGSFDLKTGVIESVPVSSSTVLISGDMIVDILSARAKEA